MTSVYETLRHSIKSREALLYANNPSTAKQSKVCLYKYNTKQGIIWDGPKSKIKTVQQRLLPYFFANGGFNCLFLFGESAYVNYTSLCLRKIRVKNIFSTSTNTLTECKHEKTTAPHIHTSTALPLAHWRKLKHLSPPHPPPPRSCKNLASLSNFSFFSFFFWSWSDLGFPRHSRIQFSFFFPLLLFFGAQNFLCRALWDS